MYVVQHGYHTYVRLECDYRHPGLFPHGVFERRNLFITVVRSGEEAVGCPQNEIICL